MRYELATNKQLMSIINHDKDLPTHLLSGLVEESIKRGLWDAIIIYAGKRAYHNVPYVLSNILKIEKSDLFQIAYIEIVRIIDTFKPGIKSFKDYVIMCLIGKFHVIRDYATREKRSSDLKTEDIDDLPSLGQGTVLTSPLNVEKYVINKITIEEVWDVLREIEQKAIKLYLIGYTQWELSEMLGLSRRSGQTILARAYAKLRKAMVA
jgi:RNA polymerase sigma factor (sigma-70 family)